jgi:hypothetical protein
MTAYNNAAQQAATWATSNTSIGAQGMSAINNAWQPAMSIDSSGNLGVGTNPLRNRVAPQVHFTVKKVDNGFILKGSRNLGDTQKIKICKDMDELKDLFVSSMVEYELEK